MTFSNRPILRVPASFLSELRKLGRFAGSALAAIVVGAIVWSELLTRVPPTGRVVHVTYWEKWTGFESDAMRNVVNAFNASQNRVHVDFLTISGIENKTLLAAAGGDPPDIAGLYGPNVAQYADDHAIIPLDDYC
ncbi:MAG TPA: hypothetical protein VGS41_04415, partial [Chthonomonadales bacterium]|nr:hypothetical protein [Chthonomonadales bacterium]